MEIINKKIDISGYMIPPMFKGKDGNSYTTLEDLDRADEEWNRRNLWYIGRDSEYYTTLEDLDRADEEWNRRNLMHIGK